MSDFFLIYADCLQKMKGMADSSFDLVLTDPPCPNFDWPYGHWNTKEWLDLMGNVLTECKRIVKPGCKIVIIFCPSSSQHAKIIQEAMNDLVHLIGSCNVLACGNFRCVVIENPIKLKRWFDKFEKNKPTIKPSYYDGENNDSLFDLCAWWIKKLVPSDGMVLDPFSGSGTTVCAAASLGRSATGVERFEKYHKMAQAKLRDVLENIDSYIIKNIPTHYVIPPAFDYQITYTDRPGSTWVKTATGAGSQVDFNDTLQPFTGTTGGTLTSPLSRGIVWPIVGVKLELKTTPFAGDYSYTVTYGFITC
jgi:DNA modification methylase